jgi:hypothetical protein
MSMLHHWYIGRAWLRSQFEIYSIDDCQCVGDEVYFGFVLPAELDNDTQLSFNFNC